MDRVTLDAITGLSGLAHEYAVNHYGERTGVGVPRLIADHSMIEFPILCYTHHGYLEVGILRIDRTGAIVAAPSRDEVAQAAETLIARLEIETSPSLPGLSGPSVAPRL